LESSTQIQKKIFEDQEGGRPGGRNQGWMMRRRVGGSVSRENTSRGIFKMKLNSLTELFVKLSIEWKNSGI